MLDNGEMPPKDAPQPTPARRKRLRTWVADYLRAESLASAGDPGPVVLRRLSNAEYTYTLLDLIGTDLQPAREFPGDNAAGEGFTNTGNALVMSPALLSKYLDAGKKIASHAVLLPDGIRFAPGATRRDWTDEILAQIRSFYGRFTESAAARRSIFRGSSSVRMTAGCCRWKNTCGRRSSIAKPSPRGPRVSETSPGNEDLNAKYLGILWSTLHGAEPLPILESLRARWRSARVEDAPALVAEIAGWQKSLWRFTSVGQIGKIGGPKAWMEPVSPLVRRPGAAAHDAADSSSSGDGHHLPRRRRRRRRQ